MLAFLYQKIIKPVLFLFPADQVHRWFLFLGKTLGAHAAPRAAVKKLFHYHNQILAETVAGISFSNPVGLAAGFDYDADLIQITPAMGFGFHTIGTVTYGAYPGNPPPMLGRLPLSQSLLVNKGFKNSGIKAVLKKVSSQRGAIPLGISIGSTNQRHATITDLIEDIAKSFEDISRADYFDYVELNISCPNLINIEHLSEKPDTSAGFTLLLERLSRIPIPAPLFVKMHVEKSVPDTVALCDIAARYPFVRGMIFANLVKDRNNPAFDKKEIASAGKGNFSGKPTEKQSNILITEVYKKYKARFVIVGCGGIFTGADAYEKIRRGASLVQLITGMVYCGPQQIGAINRELAALLRADGYANVKEAIGTKTDF